MAIIGKVESLWRYPVNSMRGEELSEAFVGFAGVYGDRPFAFRSAGRPSGFPYLTGREQRKMILYRPRFHHPDKAAKPNLAEAESTEPGLNPIFADPADLASGTSGSDAGAVSERQAQFEAILARRAVIAARAKSDAINTAPNVNEQSRGILFGQSHVGAANKDSARPGRYCPLGPNAIYSKRGMAATSMQAATLTARASVDSPEQRCGGPDKVHDPHVLGIAEQVGGERAYSSAASRGRKADPHSRCMKV